MADNNDNTPAWVLDAETFAEQLKKPQYPEMGTFTKSIGSKSKADCLSKSLFSYPYSSNCAMEYKTEEL